MPRSVLLTCILVLVLFSCKDKEVNCSATKFKIPCAVAFKGFSATDLDTILVECYKGGSNLTQFIRTDSLKPSSISFSVDTAFAGQNNQPFTTLDAGIDYRIFIPAQAKTYALTNRHYISDTIIRWTRKRDCGTYGTTVIPPDNITINGVSTSTTSIVTAMSWIVLEK